MGPPGHEGGVELVAESVVPLVWPHAGEGKSPLPVRSVELWSGRAEDDSTRCAARLLLGVARTSDWRMSEQAFPT